jgi:hypothetical protein
MACKTCNKKPSGVQQKLVEAPQDCLYTFEQLTNKLNEVLQDPNHNPIHTFYLKSAIGWYSKDCNKFNKYLPI